VARRVLLLARLIPYLVLYLAISGYIGWEDGFGAGVVLFVVLALLLVGVAFVGAWIRSGQLPGVTTTKRSFGRKFPSGGARDSDGIDPIAWAMLRESVQASQQGSDAGVVDLLSKLVVDPELLPRVLIYAMGILGQIVTQKVGADPDREAVKGLFSGIESTGLTRLREEHGVDPIDSLIGVLVEGVLPSRDAIGVMITTIAIIVALGQLMPYPMAELTNRRAQLVHDLPMLRAKIPASERRAWL
jgi:hypothetical protein